MSDSRTNGISFCSALFLIFLTLRLTDHIDWEWYWIAAPLWIPAGIAVGILGVVALCWPIAWLVSSIADGIRKRRRLKRHYDAMRGKP